METQIEKKKSISIKKEKLAKRGFGQRKDCNCMN